MKTIFVLLVTVTCLFSCTNSKKITSNSDNKTQIGTVADNDGSSFEKAIVIQEKTESTGVDAEYAWLRKNYPGYGSKGQVLQYHNNKNYDRIDIVTADGKEKSIYFDISNFFGKF